MADTTEMHPLTTTLPDGLWQRFEEERREEDHNITQHLRVIVKRYFERIDSTPAPAMPTFRPWGGMAPGDSIRVPRGGTNALDT